MTDVMNVTTAASGISMLGNSWFSIVIVVGLAAVILSLVFMILGSFKFYVKSRKALKFILGSVQYFFLGCIFILILAFPITIFMWLFTQAKKGNIIPLKYSLYLVIGYIVISLLGYIFKKYVYERIKLFDVKFRKLTKKEQDNLKGVPY